MSRRSDAMNRDHPSVLIIEDDPSVGCLEAAIVKRSGATSDLVTSGSAALDAISRNAPDVLIFGSPAERNPDLFALLAGPLRPLASRTIVLTTYMEDETFLEQAARAGVYAVVAKPFDVNTLRDVVADCASNAGRHADVTWIGVEPSVLDRVTGAR